MALNIKNQEVEQLVSEVSAITGESKTEVVRKALQERKAQLAFRTATTNRKTRVIQFLEQEVWSGIPINQLGRKLTKEEEEALLGYEDTV